MVHKINKIEVHLVSAKVAGGFQDATRNVETIGYTIVRIITDQGLEGFGVTYHEVGGEAIKSLIVNNMAPKLIGSCLLYTYESGSIRPESFVLP